MSLTKKAKLVARAEGMGGRARHYQVVYRQSQREEWVTTLKPGSVFRPTLLQRARKFVVYEVTAEPEIEHSFPERFLTLDEVHDFTLEFTVYYRVAETEGARRLVESLSSDPILRLQKYLIEWVGGAARHLPWEVLWEGGREFRKEVKGSYNEAGTWVAFQDRLGEKATSWGLEILRLKVSRVLPPTAVSPDETQQISKLKAVKSDIASLHLDAKAERVKKELEHDQAEVDLDRRLRLETGRSIENVIEMMRGMIDRAGARVDSFPEMIRAIRQLQGVRQEVALLTQPMSAEGSSFPLDPMDPALPPPPTKSIGPGLPNRGLAQPLEDIQLHLSDLPDEIRRDVLSPIFLLLAELIRGSRCDDERVEELQESIDDGLGQHLTELVGDQIDAIRRLADVPSLRKKLRLEKAS